MDILQAFSYPIRSNASIRVINYHKSIYIYNVISKEEYVSEYVMYIHIIYFNQPYKVDFIYSYM